MTLRDETVAIYSALDSTTLLALLPVLRREGERAKEATQKLGDLIDQIRNADVELAETFAETMFKIENRKEAHPNELDDLSEVQEQLRQAWQRSPRDSDRNTLFYLANAQYMFDFLERELWIKNELVRRGLLPKFPELPAP